MSKARNEAGLNGENPQGASPRDFLLRLGPEEAWRRLDACLGQALAGRLSREKIKKAILRGAVSLNGTPCQSPKSKVGPGDELRLSLDLVLDAGLEPPLNSTLPVGRRLPLAEAGPLEILYRDADLAVINKPAGLTVHPCPSCPDGTLVNRLLAHFPELTAQPASACASVFSNAEDFESFPDQASQSGDRPGIVHRLDKDTTGLLLVALNEGTRLKLAAAFAARQVKKEYLALVYGVPAERAGVISVPIGRDPANKTRMTALPDAAKCSGREALSEYRTLYGDPAGLFSLLAVRIHTGRTHQIRVHLRFLGHPIIGDSVYFDYRVIRSVLEPFAGKRPAVLENSRTLRAFTRLFAARPLLHAWKLSLAHPRLPEKNLSFSCPPPEDFYACLAVLGPRVQPVILTGNVGCGKSTVLAGLRQRGIPIWSADQAVADLYRPGQGGWHLLRSAFGSRFVPDGAAEVDKQALFAAMREDERLRRDVEKLIHPLAAQAMRDFFAGCSGLPGLRATGLETPAEEEKDAVGGLGRETAGEEEKERAYQPEPALAVAEVPLYFEAGWAARATEAGRPGPESGAWATGFDRRTPSVTLVLGVHCPRAIRAERLRLKRGWPEAMIDKMESWQWDEEKKMRSCDLVLDNSGVPEDLDGRIDEALSALADLRERALRDLLDRVRALTGSS